MTECLILLLWQSNVTLVWQTVSSFCHDRATSLWYDSVSHPFAMTEQLHLGIWQTVSSFCHDRAPSLWYDRLPHPFAMTEQLHFGMTDCLVLLPWQSNFTLIWQTVSSFYHDRATSLWYDRYFNTSQAHLWGVERANLYIVILFIVYLILVLCPDIKWAAYRWMADLIKAENIYH